MSLMQFRISMKINIERKEGGNEKSEGMETRTREKSNIRVDICYNRAAMDK